jgi:hypothetical protein
MILRNGFPIAAKTARVDIQWDAPTNDTIEFADAQITFENINTTTAGEIQQERTVLPFSPSEPIPWPDTIPTGISSVWTTPESALRDILGILYESDEHQYRLGTMDRPVVETSATQTSAV